MESSVLKKAYDRWHVRPARQSRPPGSGSVAVSLEEVLGLPPEIVEEYATLAYRLERALAGVSSRTVVVGSPTRETGNSTVAVGLAATLAASSGVTTLLVDANLRAPSLHQKFGLERQPGLTDLVRGRSDAADVLVETAVPGLTLLPSGAPDPAPQGFFQLSEFQTLLSQWSTEYGYVILDSAPFGTVAEPLNLAQTAAGVLMVVQAARTSREVASGVIDKLRASGVLVLGAVLNRRQFYIPDWIYRRV
jgi:capsular exopolysaccharide synthesis family protein